MWQAYCKKGYMDGWKEGWMDELMDELIKDGMDGLIRKVVCWMSPDVAINISLL